MTNTRKRASKEGPNDIQPTQKRSKSETLATNGSSTTKSKNSKAAATPPKGYGVSDYPGTNRISAFIMSSGDQPAGQTAPERALEEASAKVPENPASDRAEIKERRISPDQLGLRVLYEHKNSEEIEVDIIAVHGIGAHPDHTWTAIREDGDRPDGQNKHCYWLKDEEMLPAVIPRSRILRFAYDSMWYGTNPVKQRLQNIATDMLHRLVIPRENCRNRPIIFIGHCFGGLVIQKAYLLAKSNDYDHPGIALSTTGIIFMGTPHEGTGRTLQSGGEIYAAVVARASHFKIQNHILKTLDETNETLIDVVGLFSRVINLPDSRITIFCFFETRETVVGKIVGDKSIEEFVVNEKSGSLYGHPREGLPLDHFNLNKFQGPDDGNYIAVRDVIQRMARAIARASGSSQMHDENTNSRVTDPTMTGLRADRHIALRPIYDHIQVPSQTHLQDELSSSNELFPANGSDVDSPVTAGILARRQELMDLLYFDEIDARLLSLRDAHNKTCMWFLENEKYRQWLDLQNIDNHHGFLWIKGKPGSGKSILMKFLEKRNKLSATKDSNRLFASFFFYAPGEHLEKSTLGLYRSLLWQLLQNATDLQQVLDEFNLNAWRVIKRSGWQNEALKKTIERAIYYLGDRDLSVFIDALDECRDDDIADMVSFFEDLGERAAEKNIRLRICFSSRHYPTIELKCGFEIVLEKQDEHSKDIARYITYKLKLPRSKRSEDFRKEVLEKSAGIFLWVALVIPMLNKTSAGGRVDQLQKCLNTTPMGLNNLFDKILTRDDEDMAELRFCIQLILFAIRPVTLTEYFSALRHTGDEDLHDSWATKEIDRDIMGQFVLSSSKGLAEVTKTRKEDKDPTVQFIHESVRDFFYSGNGRRRLWPSFNRNEFTGFGHDTLKLRCLGEIEAYQGQDSQASAKSAQDRIRTWPFLCYATDNILLHANQAQQYGVSQDEFLLQFSGCQQDWVKFNNAFEKFKSRHYSDKVDIIYILAERGLDSLLQIHPRLSSHLSICGGRYFLPLAAAAILKHKATARVLVASLCPDPLFADGIEGCVTALPVGRSYSLASLKDFFNLLLQLGHFPLIEYCIVKFPRETHRQVFERHSHWGRVVAFSPDGQTLASASADKTVRLWHAVTGVHLQTLEGHCDWVQAVAFSPDGQMLASASVDKTVRLWHAVTGVHRQTLEGHSHGIHAVAFSPDGRTLASASSDGTVRLWDAVTCAFKQTLEGHSSWVRAVAFSPDGQMLASASADKTVRLWDAVTGVHLHTLEGHRYWVHAVAFSPDGRTLASASSDRTVRLWDAVTYAFKQTLEGHSSRVQAVAFSPDGRTLASASSDGTVRLWDTATCAFKQTLEEHSSWVRGVAFSPDCQTLASDLSNKTVGLWDAATGAYRQTLGEHSGAVRTAWDGSPQLEISGSLPLQSRDLEMDLSMPIKAWDAGTQVSSLPNHAAQKGAEDCSKDGTGRGHDAMAKLHSEHGNSTLATTVITAAITADYVFSEAGSDSATTATTDNYDDKTVYSEEGSLGGMGLDRYKSELVDDLVNKMCQLEAEPKTLEKVFGMLPLLFKSFALRIGQPGSSQAQRDVMYFVHKSRGQLAQLVKQSMMELGAQDSAPSRESGPLDSELAFSRTRNWITESVSQTMDDPSSFMLPAENETISSFAKEATPGTPECEEEIDISDKHGYRQVVFESAAYHALVSNLARETLLTPVGEDDAMKKIHTRILGILPQQQHISRYTESETFTLALCTEWDPVSFIKDQYDATEMRKDILERAITLTGSMGDAQALPCSEYLNQTWPTTGLDILAAVVELVQTGDQAIRVLTDRSEIAASFEGPGEFKMLVKGTADFIAEVGEIVAWLATALRVSSDANVIQTCSPRISGELWDPFTYPSSGVYSCRIDFDFDVHRSAEHGAGQCWHGMFRNPVVVTGFPIPRRQRSNSGLEIPLKMATSLTGAPRVHEFHGRQFLKGFSAMLAAVEVVGDLVLWHMYYNPKGEWISYTDAFQDRGLEVISVNQLRTRRHVVGWCSDASYMFGDRSANYDIKNSELPLPGKEFALEKFSFSVGQIVTGACQFSVGRKDSPVHITKNTYQSKMQWLRQRYFIMWDEDEKRGWLTRGISAVLHLLRASFEHLTNDETGVDFLFKAFQEPEESHRFRSSSAAKLLCNRVNRELKLYEHKRVKTVKQVTQPDGTVEEYKEESWTYETVEDRVDELFETLDKLVCHEQDRKALAKGIDAKPRIRSYLEGWEFRDIATNSDPFHLRVMKPPTSGRTWVDFAKSIGAVTFFGRGFGELIKPATASCTHPSWQSIPTGKGFLGACVSDLREIIHNRGGAVNTNPLKVSGGIIWHNPSKHDIFTTGSGVAGWSPVQELLPEGSLQALPFLRSWGSKIDITSGKHEHGAVIFGRTKSSKFTWPDALDDPVVIDPAPTAPSIEDTPMQTLEVPNDNSSVDSPGAAGASTGSGTQAMQPTSPSSRTSMTAASGLFQGNGPQRDCVDCTGSPPAATSRKRDITAVDDEEPQKSGIRKRLRDVRFSGFLPTRNGGGGSSTGD